MKIFLTGATGYVGGDALYAIATANPAHHISCLVRDSSRATLVTKAFPSVRIVDGDLDNAELVEREAQDADVVLNLASTSHVVSANAIAKGLTATGRNSPGHWIQMSGATLFAGKEIASGTYGEQYDGKVYNDLEDIKEIGQVISSSPKRVVDNLVQSQDSSKVKTALVVGPLIYGEGRGPVHVRSIQAPEIARNTLELGQGFKLGKGLNSWSNIHVHDLSQLFVALLGQAEPSSTKKDIWNADGVYLPENGVLAFGKLSELIAQEAQSQGLISDSDIKTIDAEEADKLSGHASILWGTNALIKSARPRTTLGWKPSKQSLEELVPRIVRDESDSRKTKP